MRSLVISFACIAAAGCASMHAQQVGTLIDPYIGQPVSELVNRFGPPSGSFASSVVSTTYEWSNFANQSGMTGCRVLVVASRTDQDSTSGFTPYGIDSISADEFWKWKIKSWSSFGSGCR